jgi:hypothetical protein
MEDVFLSAELGDGRIVCVSPLSARSYRESGGKGLGGDYGYFLYEVNREQPGAGFNVIAKAASVEAAMRLFDLLTVDHARAISSEPLCRPALPVALPLAANRMSQGGIGGH